MYGIKLFVLGFFNTNTYVVYNEHTLDGIIVDPGSYSKDLIEWIKSRGLNIVAIMATHGHFDHLEGVDKLRDELDAEFLIHRDDLEILDYNYDLARQFNIDYRKVEPDKVIDREGYHRFKSIEIYILHTPGHTPGSITIYIPSISSLLTGDTLFSGSVGTTELPGGCEEDLLKSLCKIYSLYPLETIVLPGHGPKTTLDKEYRANLFVINALNSC